MTSLSVRARVALSTAIVALVVLIGTGVVIYRELGRILTSQAVEQARHDAQRLAGLVDTGGGEQNGTAVALTDGELVSRLAQPGAATVVLDGTGRVVQASEPGSPLRPLFACSAVAPATLICADGRHEV